MDNKTDLGLYWQDVARAAKATPAAFSMGCYEIFGIRYNPPRGKLIDVASTLGLYKKLQEIFGFVTDDMAYALMNYRPEA